SPIQTTATDSYGKWGFEIVYAQAIRVTIYAKFPGDPDFIGASTDRYGVGVGMLTETWQVSESAHDGLSAEEREEFDTTIADPTIGHSPHRHLFHYFSNVVLPSKCVIKSAYMIVYYHGKSNRGATTKIFADDQPRPPVPTNYFDHMRRTRTTNNVPWERPWPDSRGWLRSPDIKVIIQELVDKYSYSDGAPISILWDDYTDYDWTRIYHYDHAPEYAPKLEITYTPAPHVLTVESTPSGVPVTLDGTPIGSTPVEAQVYE
ncbi:unnamed protein product, partial [marine sediment metagenome]